MQSISNFSVYIKIVYPKGNVNKWHCMAKIITKSANETKIQSKHFQIQLNFEPKANSYCDVLIVDTRFP